MSNIVVQVADLTKTYRLYRGPRALFKELFLGIPGHTSVTALRDVSFKVEEGEAFGIVGDNGAGKTTLFNMITGRDTPDSGTFKLGETVPLAYAAQDRELKAAVQSHRAISGAM